MALASVSTKDVLYKGCPPDCRHVVYVRPDGNEVAVLLPVDPSWDVFLFVEAEFYRFFLVATSPDKEQLRIERWMTRHSPRRLLATTQAEQATALNGKHAGNATPEELATEATPTLTSSDEPVAIPPRGVEVVPMKAPDPQAANPNDKRGDFLFFSAGPEGKKVLRIRILAKGILDNNLLTTKATEAALVEAFCHVDQRTAYFLFDQGADYFLETLEWWASTYRRLEATATKASMGGLSNEDIVKAMAPNLAKV